MNCPKCFSENLPNAAFCKNCGSRIVNLPQSVRSDIITIGRASDNSICINAQGISSKHAKIFSENNQVYIEDLNSTNGTFVNGKKITCCELKLNDNVSLGHTPLNLYEIQIKKLFSSSGIPATTNKTSIENGYSYPQVNNFPSQPNPQFQAYPNQAPPPYQSYNSNANQVNVNVMAPNASKSVGVALLLTFLFGSFGMFYSTITGGIVMSCINLLLLLLGFLTLGVAWFGFFLTMPICMIWAAIAASETNRITPISTQTHM